MTDRKTREDAERMFDTLKENGFLPDDAESAGSALALCHQDLYIILSCMSMMSASLERDIAKGHETLSRGDCTGMLADVLRVMDKIETASGVAGPRTILRGADAILQ